jgi:2-phospho-L-lactate guanylyltransferase
LTIAIIPAKRFENSKSRLSTILNPQDRAHLSALMLQDTLTTVARSRLISEVAVVSADVKAGEIAEKFGATILSQTHDAGVNSAVALADKYAVEARHTHATLVIPQDLPLMGAGDIDAICSAAVGRCIVICPSIRYDGTNLLLRRPPNVISTSYDRDSFNSHIKCARAVGATVRVIEQEHIMFDLDTPADAEMLVQMDGRRVAAKNVASFLKEKLKA